MPSRHLHDKIREFRSRWDSYVGDRDLEVAIRKDLDANGYGGSTAAIFDTRLAGTVRPGWVQVSTFRVQAKHRASGERRELYGVSREDERRAESAIRLLASVEDRDALLTDWTEGMLTLEGVRGRRRSRLEVGLLLFFLLMLAVAVTGAILGGS